MGNESGSTRSEEWATGVLHKAPVMLWVSDTGGDLVYVNECWETTFGRPASLELGTRWLEHVHPEERESVRNSYLRGIEDQRPFELRYHAGFGDGQYRWVMNRAGPRFEAGNYAGFVGICEARGDEAPTNGGDASEPLSYRTLAEAIPALVLTTTVDGEVEYCNSRMMEYCGTDIGGLRQARWVNYIHPDDVSGGRHTWLELVAEEKPFSAEYRIRRADGTYRWHLTHTAPLPSSEQGIRGWVAASIDVDDRHKAEDDAIRMAEELQRASAAKDEFLGLISHELRTPITTIYGNAQVLRRNAGRLDIETLWTSLSDIEQETQRLQQIIDNMFVLARIEANAPIHTEPVLLSRILERVVRDHRARWPERAVIVNDDLSLEPVLGEELYVEQIIRNMLSNAQKYGLPGSAVVVTIARDGALGELRVVSSGKAPTDTELAQVFDPFYRAGTTASRASGAGIGLTVCKRLAEAMDGSVWAKAVDDGFEAGFSLPLETEA